MADTVDLKSTAVRREGSNPSTRTNKKGVEKGFKMAKDVYNETVYLVGVYRWDGADLVGEFPTKVFPSESSAMREYNKLEKSAPEIEWWASREAYVYSYNMRKNKWTHIAGHRVI